MVAIKTIGRVLKERRTELGLGLAEAEAFTKIQKLYIVALETDDYKALPGEFYVKAYLKQYAEKLDLDADKILAAYEAGKGINVLDEDDFGDNYRFVKPSERSAEEEAEQAAAAAGEKDWHYYAPIISLSAVALLIVAAVVVAVVVNNRHSSDLIDAGAAYSQSTAKASSAAKSEASSHSTEASSSKKPETDKLEVSGSNNLLTANLTQATQPVKVVISENGAANAWVLVRNSDMDTAGVTIDDSTPSVTATLVSGATQSTITLGNHNDLTMTINGKDVDLTKLGHSGGPYNINLTVTPNGASATTSTSAADSTTQNQTDDNSTANTDNTTTTGNQ